MSSQFAKTRSPSDVTVDAPSTFSDATECASRPCRVHLVEGSGLALSGETENLLRSRLRSAALLIFFGSAAFLVWHTFWVEFETWQSTTLYAGHVVCTVILGLIGLLLCRSCRMSTGQLRTVELLTFGVPAAFFLLRQHNRTVQWADGSDFLLPELCTLWLLMIFTYALFIPTTWRRAAVVIGLMAVAPLASAAATAFFDRATAELFASHPRLLVDASLFMALGGVAAVLGVHTINSLRSEAYQAKQLGQYKLKRLIGSGGMGEVYLGEHLLMKRPCAIKIIRPEKAGDPKVLARFEREVQAIAKLSHWNSIDIFDYGRADDGTFYYVMEYLPGMNLAELVQRYGPMPTARALHLVRQVCEALREAHGLGLIHRDIKPANIFAAARGGMFDVAKVLDFGLAKPLADVTAAQLTQEGTITGSPLYMSPEQALGDREPDARSDIYSLGAVLYFLVTGRPPFEDENSMKVLIAHAHEPPQPPSQYNRQVPDDVEMIIMRCLQKNSLDRYQSAAELAKALEECDDFGRWTGEMAKKWWEERDIEISPSRELVTG